MGSIVWGESWGSSWGVSWRQQVNLDITDTDALQLPVDYQLHGLTVKEKGNTREGESSKAKSRMVAWPGGSLGKKTTFTTRVSKRGYE